MERSRLLVLAAYLLAIPAGIGAFTFVYAKGFSYLSTDPRACANCHIMNLQYDAWLKSGHRHVAGCIDCHLPHAGLAKWVAKADHGFRHSAAFTLQNFKEPIEITPRDRRLVQTTAWRVMPTSFIPYWGVRRPEVPRSIASTVTHGWDTEREADLGSHGRRS